MCTMPPEGMRRRNVSTTWAVSRSTVSWIRLLAAAVLPSTAKNALLMATTILVASKPTTAPFRFMTRISPGAGVA